MEQENRIALFEDSKIRRIWRENRWFFNIADVMSALTGSKDGAAYWRKLKERITKTEWADEFVTICHRLKFEAADGKFYAQDAADAEGILRLLQSVPSPKVEPFKRWLAKTGYERLQEIDDPALAIERTRELYRAKGYPEEWIEMRLKSIGIRQQLTDEWKTRSVHEGKEYSILTAEIARATFGLTPSEHKKVKSLERENLRDHMTNLELIFTMLGEETTKTLAVKTDAQGFAKNRAVAQTGGKAAGKAREQLEAEAGIEVVSSMNFKNQITTAMRSGDIPAVDE